MRKRYQTVILCIVIVSYLMTACQNHYRENATPTGYEPGEIGQPQIMYEGTVYYYQFTGFDEPLPDGYTLVGEVEEVDNRNYPLRDWAGCRLQKGQEIYADDDKTDAVYVAYDKGFAKFSASAEDPSRKREQVYFNGQWYDAGKLSDGTLEWLAMYNSLSEEEQLSFSYIPWDLRELSGLADGEDARTEETASEEDQEGAFGVELEATDVTEAGLTLICRQSGGYVSGELQTGTAYFLEKREDGQWTQVQPLQELVWEDIALLIPMGGNTEWKIDWSDSFGTLPDGFYRIGKEITDFRAAGDYDTTVCYAEFEIEERDGEDGRNGEGG